MEKIPWYRQKTVWASLGIILGALMQLFPAVFPPGTSESVMVIFGALTAIFMRAGIEKTKVTGIEQTKKAEKGEKG